MCQGTGCLLMHLLQLVHGCVGAGCEAAYMMLDKVGHPWVGTSVRSVSLCRKTPVLSQHLCLPDLGIGKTRYENSLTNFIFPLIVSQISPNIIFPFLDLIAKPLIF